MDNTKSPAQASSLGGGGHPDLKPRVPAAAPVLMPPELLEYTFQHLGGLSSRRTDQTSLLRHFSKPGHIHGEGFQRLYIGAHPDEKAGRTFLIGVDVLWAEESVTNNKLDKGKAVDGAEANLGHARDKINNAELDVDTGGDDDDSFENEQSDEHGNNTSWGDGPESGDSSESDEDIEELRQSSGAERSKKTSVSTDADTLFAKLRSGDNRMQLSEGSMGQDQEKGNALLHPEVLSRRMQESPMSIGTSAALSFVTAQAFLTPNGERTTDKPILDSIREQVVANSPQTGGGSEAVLQVQHNLLRRASEPLLPDTASDTVVAQSERPKAQQLKSTKSVRWDMTKPSARVPQPKKPDVAQQMPDGSGNRRPADPEQVLSRPDPVKSLESQAKKAFTKDGNQAPFARSDSSESAQLLTELGISKESALPPGVEKLERMLVRVGWTKRQDLPEGFDEYSARQFPIRFKRWEEMAVVWRRNRLELHGAYPDPFRRFLTPGLQLKHVIPLRPKKTSLSVYTSQDQIFALMTEPEAVDGHHASKPGLRNKRHMRHTGTIVILMRARSPTIAQDWYLGLYIALDSPKLDTLEIHFPAVEVRVRVPTSTAVGADPASEVAIAAARELLSAGGVGRELVSKEDMLVKCAEMLGQRRDWAELLENMYERGIKLEMAWRRGTALEWLTHGRSVDGLKRVWDLYTGAVMKQASQATHRLEVYPQQHYPSAVRLRYNDYLIEPPDIEGYISRLRQRNELQREKMYVSSHGGFLILCKAKRAYPPDFPDANKWVEEAKGKAGAAVKAFLREEKQRALNQIARCKGSLRLRDIDNIAMDNACSQCSSTAKNKLATDSNIAQGHDHQIIHMDLSDGRRIRFELDPPEAGKEWLERLKALVAYWTKREQDDARNALSLSGHASHRPTDATTSNGFPAFQDRLREDELLGPATYNPVLAQAFNFCTLQGCRHNVIKQGRLYFKRGHRDSTFVDRFFVLVHDHLVEFETTRRNLQKRPVPLAYHRRIRTVRLRDVYLITAESCSEFLTRPKQSTFDPSTDQSSLARIYKDGLVSLDDPMDCTFALWKQRGSAKGAGLGNNGRAFVFQARSRLDRDQWVQALNVTCERIARSTRDREIRLATFSTIK